MREYLVVYKEFAHALFLNVAAHIMVPIHDMVVGIIVRIDKSLTKLESKTS